MIHTKECQDKQIQSLARRQEWVEQWPDYCKTCGGAGEHSWTENGAPWGEGFWPMPMSEPCADCTEQGVCARCHQGGLSNEEQGDSSTGVGPCLFCGWNYDDSIPFRYWDDPCECYFPEAEKELDW